MGVKLVSTLAEDGQAKSDGDGRLLSAGAPDGSDHDRSSRNQNATGAPEISAAPRGLEALGGAAVLQRPDLALEAEGWPPDSPCRASNLRRRTPLS